MIRRFTIVFCTTLFGLVASYGQELHSPFWLPQSLSSTTLYNEEQHSLHSKAGFNWGIQSKAIHIPTWQLYGAWIKYNYHKSSLALNFTQSGSDEWAMQAAALSFSQRILPQLLFGFKFHSTFLNNGSEVQYNSSIDAFTQIEVSSWQMRLDVNRVATFSNSEFTQWRDIQLQTDYQYGPEQSIFLAIKTNNLAPLQCWAGWSLSKETYSLSSALGIDGSIHVQFGYSLRYFQAEFGFSLSSNLLSQPTLKIGHVEVD